MDDINTQNQYMDYQPEENPGWWSRTMSGLKNGATMYAAGSALSKVPKMGWAGNLIKGFGKFDMQTAPIYSTTQPLSDKLEDTSTPTTVKGHTKKWLRNTGKDAGISAGLWGVGKGVALAGAATANPFVAGAGTALMGLGSMGMAYSWLSPTISTAIDVWLNKRRAKEQQDATTMQPKMASLYKKGNTTMNYVELVQMVKKAYAPVPQQAQQQTDQNPKITAGRVAEAGLGGAGLGLATAGAGYVGGAALGGGINGVIAGRRLKKYMPGYGDKANFASKNLGTMFRRTDRIANTMRNVGARGGVRGATIGLLASIPAGAFIGNAYGKHLRNKWQQQDAQQKQAALTPWGLEREYKLQKIDRARREAPVVGGVGGVVAGVPVGLAAGGLTYGALSLIPGIKKKRLIKALLSLGIGGAAGAATGVTAGQAIRDLYWDDQTKGLPNPYKTYELNYKGNHIGINPNKEINKGLAKFDRLKHDPKGELTNDLDRARAGYQEVMKDPNYLKSLKVNYNS